MDKTNMKSLRQKLESQRQEILQYLSRLELETRSLDVDTTQDSADRCVLSMSKEALFERSSQRRTMLRLIEAALNRIADDSFGVCVACGDDIQQRRLEALPWTQFCLRCQAAIEEEVGETLSAQPMIPTGGSSRRAG